MGIDLRIAVHQADTPLTCQFLGGGGGGGGLRTHGRVSVTNYWVLPGIGLGVEQTKNSTEVFDS